MWKKDDVLEPSASPRPEMSATGFERSAPPRSTGERATIGRSITISGEVTGDEDLLIQGRVDGSVNLKQHSVTVGPEGEVKANITGRVVVVDGKVEGNITADEQVILRSAARVEGDIAAPRVVLEDGARFRGGVDMGESLERGSRAKSSTTPAAETKSTSGSVAAGAEKSASTGMKGGASPAASQVAR